MLLVDADGNTVASYEYDPYGKVISATGTMAEINPIRYRGYYYDSETGFYYLQSRYYDPTTCRFINADSYASTGQGVLGHNMLAYCGNNPVTRVDSTGRFWDYEVESTTTVVLEDADGDITYATTITYKRPCLYTLLGVDEIPTQKVSFEFTVRRNGSVTFDNKQDDAYAIKIDAVRESLAREMLQTVRKQVDRALLGRSVQGLSYELLDHYLVYIHNIPFITDNAEVAHMGGISKAGPGYDSNAFVFEMHALYNEARRLALQWT